MIEALQAFVAIALCFGALAAGIAAACARALFSAAMYAAGAAVLAAGAVAAFAAEEGALIIVLTGVLWTPLLLLATMLLTARTTKPAKRMIGVAVVLLAAPLAGVVIAPVLVSPPAGVASEHDAQLSFWLAPLIAAAACTCAALLGYGERGALQRGRE